MVVKVYTVTYSCACHVPTYAPSCMRGACACTQGRSVLRSEYGCTGLSCKICLICTQREVHEHTPHYIHIVLLCITVSIMVNAFLNNGTVVQGAAVLKAVHKCRGNKCNFGAGSEEVDVAAVGRGLDGLDRVDSEDKEDDEVSKPAAVRCAGAGAGAVRHRRGSGPGREEEETDCVVVVVVVGGGGGSGGGGEVVVVVVIGGGGGGGGGRGGGGGAVRGGGNS